MQKTITGAALAAMVLTVIAAQAAPTLADKCEATKNKTAGAYYSCREKAEAAAISKGVMPDYSKCTAKFDDKWDGAEIKGEGTCPDTVTLTADMNAFIAAQAADAALVVAGAPIPDCAGDLVLCESDLTTCDGNLMACDSELAACEAAPASAQPVKTGVTICTSGNTNTPVACPGTKQDGEIQAGAARVFTNNGNGTITDGATGLMWEVHSNDGTINDKDDQYTWSNAYGKIAALNAASFATHSDWRLPNVNELSSLVNWGTFDPAVYTAFDTACPSACTIATCSCGVTSIPSYYWTSTSYAKSLGYGLIVNFANGFVDFFPKTDTQYVRAVRGGL